LGTPDIPRYVPPGLEGPREVTGEDTEGPTRV